jgi:hypothetical protein
MGGGSFRLLRGGTEKLFRARPQYALLGRAAIVTELQTLAAAQRRRRGVTLEHETFRFELDRVGLMAVIDVGRNDVAGDAVVGVDGRAACSNATAERVIGAWLSHCSVHGLEP